MVTQLRGLGFRVQGGATSVKSGNRVTVIAFGVMERKDRREGKQSRDKKNGLEWN